MTLAHTTWGNGDRAVYLLHGWMGDESTFEPILSTFEPDEVTCILPAFRGYGASTDLDGEFTIQEAADDVVDLADSLGHRTFDLVGHSMAGKIASTVLGRWPERVLRMALVTPAPPTPAEFPAGVSDVFRAAPTDLSARAMIIDNATGNRLAPSWIRHVAQRASKTSNSTAVATYFESWSASDVTDEIHGRKHEVRIYVGEHDPTLPAELMQTTYCEALTNATIEVVPNAGHYPMDEATIMLGTRLGEFLRGELRA